MEVRDFRNILLNVFVMLLVGTVFFYLYNLINPFDFPGLWQRLLFFDIGFGVLTFVLYFSEITLFFSRFKIKKPWEREVKYKSNYKKLRLKRYHPNVHILNFRKITEISKSYKSFFDEFNELSKRNKLKFLLIVVGGGGVYVGFLVWVFPKVSFDEFIFFILLLYVPLSLKLKLGPRYPILVALVLLVICAVVLVQGFEDYTNRIGIYSYYFLIIGIILIFMEYLKNPQKEIYCNYNYHNKTSWWIF